MKATLNKLVITVVAILLSPVGLVSVIFGYFIGLLRGLVRLWRA